MTATDATRAAETVARVSYGKLLAILSKRTGDIASAEDALADAFARALDVWPRRGVPDNPDAWLMTTARNRITDALRRRARFPEGEAPPDLPAAVAEPGRALPDERLALMLACAHPALPPDMHAPLILQTVLGVEAIDIARAFALAAPAMAQRLVRAKRKIRDAGIPFAIPDDAADLGPRLGALCEAVYAAHALDWLAPRDALGHEALYLADLLCHLCPEEAEAYGLAAVIAFGQARRHARIRAGVLVPLDEQDHRLWDGRLIAFGQRALSRAQALARPGRFQVEAAIQGLHLDRAKTGQVDWRTLDQLYFALDRLAPSLGATVARAVVLAERHGPEAGLAALDRLDQGAVRGFQPYWAARARLLERAGQCDAARDAYAKAISLTTEPPLRRYLEGRSAALRAPS